jgi:uncharacterized membrane protein
MIYRGGCRVMISLVTGLVLFLGAHSISIVSSDWRDRVVARIGKNAWQGVYSLIALSGIVLIAIGYGNARADPIIVYQPPPVLRYLSFALMIPAFPLLFATYLPGRIKTMARHPTLVAVKLWATAHLLANGSLADIVLFGSFLAWAVLDRISMKRRTARPIPGAPPSPFNDWVAVAGGLIVYAVLLYGGHGWITGMPLVPPW